MKGKPTLKLTCTHNKICYSAKLFSNEAYDKTNIGILDIDNWIYYWSLETKGNQ
jgi:hypothetical protein